MQAFFAAHPEYAKNKFFVTGESYAGHYVPAVAGRLHKALKNKEGVPINLKVPNIRFLQFKIKFNSFCLEVLRRLCCFLVQGFAIGNGLTQPDIQYEAYADYALDMNLITEDDYNKMSKLYPACAASIKLCGKAKFRKKLGNHVYGVG